jgi:hypothetical protein
MFGDYSGSFVGRDLSYYVKALPLSTLTAGPILLTVNMSGNNVAVTS